MNPNTQREREEEDDENLRSSTSKIENGLERRRRVYGFYDGSDATFRHSLRPSVVSRLLPSSRYNTVIVMSFFNPRGIQYTVTGTVCLLISWFHFSLFF